MNAQHLITISEVVCDEGYTDYMWNNKIVLHDTQLAHVFCPSFGWRNEADKRVAHLQLQACLYWRRRPGVAHREVWDNHDKCLPRNLPSVTKFTIIYEKNKVRIKGHILRPEVSYGLKQYYYGCYLLVIILSTLSYEILTFKLTFSFHLSTSISPSSAGARVFDVDCSVDNGDVVLALTAVL